MGARGMRGEGGIGGITRVGGNQVVNYGCGQDHNN